MLQNYQKIIEVVLEVLDIKKGRFTPPYLSLLIHMKKQAAILNHHLVVCSNYAFQTVHFHNESEIVNNLKQLILLLCMINL